MEKGDTLPARISTALLLLRIASAMAFLYHGSAILFGSFGGPSSASRPVLRMTLNMTSSICTFGVATATVPQTPLSGSNYSPPPTHREYSQRSALNILSALL